VYVPPFSPRRLARDFIFSRLYWRALSRCALAHLPRHGRRHILGFGAPRTRL